MIISPVDPQELRDLPQATSELPQVAEIRLESSDDGLSTKPSIGERLRIERERRGWSCEEVACRLKLQISLVKRIERMLYIAEYKRRQAAPGVKITRRNFGRDRRYPITNGFRDGR